MILYKFKLSVAICTWNRCDILPKCIASIEKQTAPKSSFEVLIIDNNSTDDTANIVKHIQSESCLNIRYIFEKRQGLSCARNRAIEEALGDYILYMDDDCVLYSDSLENAILALSETQSDALAGRIYNVYPDDMPKDLLFLYRKIMPTGGNTRVITDSLYPCAGLMAIKKDAAVELGGFSTEFGFDGMNKFTGEETEFSMRFYESGRKLLWEPNVRCKHIVQSHRTTVAFFLKDAFCFGVFTGLRYLRVDKKLSSRIFYGLKSLLRSVKRLSFSLFTLPFSKRLFLLNLHGAYYNIGISAVCLCKYKNSALRKTSNNSPRL